MEGDPWPLKFMAIVTVIICLVMAILAIGDAVL
jgi:hypothetical protein